MAFATVYRTKLFSADGSAYQAWLEKDGFAGSVTAVVPTEAPASVTWGKKGVDPWTPFLASHAEVENWRLASAPTGYGTGALPALIGAAVGDWRLRLVKGASHAAIDAGSEGSGYDTYWLGQVLFDGYADTTTADPHRVTVQAVDGLGTLKEQPYYDTTTTPGARLQETGKASLLAIAVKCFDRLGYALPIRSALAWRPNGESGDPLKNLQCDERAFYDADGRAMSCYDVLAEIARCTGAQWCQYALDGERTAWWLVSRELKAGTAYTAYNYDATGTAEGTATQSVGAAVDGDGAGVVRLSGGRTYRPAWGAVGVVHNHGPVPPLIEEGTFGVSLSDYSPKGRFYATVEIDPSSSSWSYSATGAGAAEADPEAYRRVTGAGTASTVTRRNFVHHVNPVFHGISRDPQAILEVVVEGRSYLLGNDSDDDVVVGPYYAEGTNADADEVGAGQTVAFTGQVRNTLGEEEPPSQGLFNTYWELRLGDTSTGYFARHDGGGACTWVSCAGTTAVDRAQFLVEPGAEDRDRGMPLGAFVPFTFIAEDAPVGGAITLRLYGSSDRGNLLENQQAIGRTEWDEVAVVVATSEGEALGATRYEAFAVDGDGYPLPLPAREDVTVRLGQGPQQRLPTTLLWDGAAATAWDSANMTAASRTDLELGALHAESLLRAEAAPLEVRQETYRGLAASPLAPLAADDPAGTGRHYAPTYLRRDLYHAETEGEWVEVAFNTTLSVSQEDGGVTADGATLTALPTGAIGTATPSPSISEVQGAQIIRHGTVVVVDGSGAGGSATVTVPLTGALKLSNIQVTPVWNTNLEDFGIDNVTANTFDVVARMTGGSTQTFIWWVIDEEGELFGEWDFSVARNSHHLLTTGF